MTPSSACRWCLSSRLWPVKQRPLVATVMIVRLEAVVDSKPASVCGTWVKKARLPTTTVCGAPA